MAYVADRKNHVIRQVAPDGRVVFDAHNVVPDGRDAVYRNTLYFRTVDAITGDLPAAGFDDITVRGGCGTCERYWNKPLPRHNWTFWKRIP